MMETTNPSRGGAIGGPPSQTIEESTLTGAYRVQQQSLGLQPTDTHEVQPFSDLSKQTAWKYSSNASNPNLPPLNTFRMLKREAEEGIIWSEEFKRLLEELPEDTRNRYFEESKLAVRDPAFADLDAALGMASVFLAWLANASKPEESGSIAETNNLQYAAIPNIMKQEIILLGNSVVSASQAFLDSVGHNNPNFDALSNIVKNMSAALKELDTQNKEGLSLLLGDLVSWNNQLQQLNIGDNLHVLKDTMKILTLITAASTLGPGAPSLLISLSAAGVNAGQDKDGGILPDSMVNMNSLLSQALSSMNPQTQTSNGDQYFQNLLISTVNTITTVVTKWAGG